MRKENNHRKARIGFATVADYESIEEYRKRRAERLAERGITLNVYRNSKNLRKLERKAPQKGLIHMDAPGDGEEQNNNQGNRGGGGGHGNTRLPFGLCQRFGIEIADGWTPKDAWAALADKGITADGAYARLKKGEDPGTPDGGETEVTKEKPRSLNLKEGDKEYKITGAKEDGEEWVILGKTSDSDSDEEVKRFRSKRAMLRYLRDKGIEGMVSDVETGELHYDPLTDDMSKLDEPVTSIKAEHYGWAEYKDVRGRIKRWVSRGEDKWAVDADRVEGTGIEGKYKPSKLTRVFHTKTDMYLWLKRKGIEQFTDPETGEVVNPQEMELPEELFRMGSAGYTAALIGLRDGRYTVVGTDFDGKKKTLDSFSSLESAKEFMDRLGVKDSDIKLSPALKKREEERTSWLKSDKKEWIERGGVKYGDLWAEMDSSGHINLSMSTEEGRLDYMYFDGKTALMKYLKDQGVERVKIGDGTKKDFENPMEYEVPDTVATIRGRDYHRLYFKESDGTIVFCGEDLDGRERTLERLYSKDDFTDFKDRIMKGYGTGTPLEESMLSTDEETEKKIEERIETDKERAKRKAEFKSKAVKFGYREYADIKMEKESYYGEEYYRLKGYDEDGDKVSVTGTLRMKDIVKKIESEGLKAEDLIKDDSVKKDFDAYMERRKEFDSKAVSFGDSKFVEPRLTKDEYGDYKVVGEDEDGRTKTICSWESSLPEIVESVQAASGGKVDFESLIKDDNLKEEYEAHKTRMKEFESKATSIMGKKYSDITIGTYHGMYCIRGYDVKGREREITIGSYKEINDTLKESGKKMEDFTMDDKAKAKRDLEIKEEQAIASGEYSDYDGHAFKDFHVEKDTVDDVWRAKATGINGKEIELVGGTYDDALEEFESRGITSYDIIRDGKKVGERPSNGMRKVRMMRSPDGSFKVMATTGKGESDTVYTAQSEEDARSWIRSKGVDDKDIRTRGMNPNDDAPRTHTQKSLEKFDEYRITAIEGSEIDDLTDGEKQEAAEMLTEIFSKGKFRCARSLKNFGNIIETGYKSQIETGTGGKGACLSKGQRRRVSNKMYGHGKLDDTEYEKCGYLGYDDEAEDYDDDAHPGYGEMTFTFRKDTIKDRVTYTYGDSLNTEDYMACAGYGGDKPTLEGLTSLGSARRIRDTIRAYQRYKNGELSYSEMFKEIREHANNEYIELQFHGPVTVKDIEVASFKSAERMDKAFSNMDGAQRKRVIKLLQDNNVKLLYRKSVDGDFVDGWERIKAKYASDFS